MLDKTIRILNFDGSLTRQKNLILRYNPLILDLRYIGRRARYWMDRHSALEITKKIRTSPKSALTFLGSGDFHHVSSILLAQFDEPLCVIDFDNHPDWYIFSPHLNCGSWVTAALTRRNIVKFVIAGASSNDLSTFSIQTGNLEALRNDRIEIYPYARESSLVFFRNVPENISIESKRGLFFTKIRWSELKDKNLVEFFLHIIRRLPIKKVYITIDKDCLTSEYALTNWEEGHISLDELVLVLKIIKENADIVGADITGDYSKIDIEAKFKKMISYFDHPKKVKALSLPESVITSINEETNLRILEAL